MIEDIVKKARRWHPEQADDLEQEARLAAFIASQKSDNVCYIRQRARCAILDLLRGKRHAIPVEEIEWDDQIGVCDVQPEQVCCVAQEDIILLTKVVRHSSARVAYDLGLTRPTMSKRVRRARERIEKCLQ